MRAFLLPLAVISWLATTTFAAASVCNGPNARTEPPAGAIVVDSTGAYKGSFQTVTEGVAKVTNNTDEHTIFVFPGIYHEQVKVPILNGPLVLQGYTCDTTSYADNEVTITHTMAQRDLPASVTGVRNKRVSTMLFESPSGMKVYNLNVANPTGKIKTLGQAVATYVGAPNHGFYGCNFTGYQDTLCANNGSELFAHTYISGAVDFIFGLQSKAWFESCDLESVGNGAVTANGNTNSSNLSEYVFNNARVFSSSTLMNGTAYLGRPWKPYARVVFQNSELGDVINPQGWQEWNKDNNTANVYLKEYNNRGPGAATDKRVSFSGQLDAPVKITDILGDNYKSEWWVDTKFL
ncbi:Pectin methylesterase [Phytophthora megakarya]|uniref:Pectinesterase n=1 Tax=Phytophthora megakarya TaxID=4795 RepID=A0A225VGS2_9STRA|nr:Pectin methylesterase [Phytophthora megakarya]